jgi:hypothetical protein
MWLAISMPPRRRAARIDADNRCSPVRAPPDGIDKHSAVFANVTHSIALGVTIDNEPPNQASSLH